jgi:mercuric ion transport protein
LSERVYRWRETLSVATPIAVLGTLVCCALPIALVAVGAGSVVASLVSTAPWLAALSRHKGWVFAISGLILVVNYWVLYRDHGAACQPGGVCHPSHPAGRWMRRIHWGSVALYVIGFTASYFSLPIAQAFGY